MLFRRNLTMGRPSMVDIVGPNGLGSAAGTVSSWRTLHCRKNFEQSIAARRLMVIPL
eukprot:IDg21858t1